MKIVEKRNRSAEKLIVNLQHERSLLLSNDIDEKVRKYIVTLRYTGRQATFQLRLQSQKP